MTTVQKKIFSDDDDSDDMGTNKTQEKLNKKRKRNAVKRFDDEPITTTTAMSETSATSIPASKSSRGAIQNKDTPHSDDIEETEEKEKKKIKREKKSKPKAIPKKKAPLDLDRQCGVLITPSMNPCTRSLTCKIHAMGAKRAVEGRTQPFNELLAAYQKKGIGRPQVPVGSNQTNQHEQQKSSSSKLSVQHQQQKQQQKTSNEDDDTNNTAIDSDEETENVRIAIEQNRPIPLGCRQVFYVRRKREYHKLRDILLEAITPKVNPTSTTSTTTASTSTL